MKESHQVTEYDVLKAVAKAAAFDGWADEAALKTAAKTSGISILDIRRLAGRTPIERIEAYVNLLNARMCEAANSADFNAYRIRDKIAYLIFKRITACEEDEHGKEALRRAAAYLMSPIHIKTAFLLNMKTADAMWRCVGDTSTDFNYYSKRLLAGGVYTSSLLYYFDDESAEYVNTRAFIDRRIDNVMGLEKAKSSIMHLIPGAWGEKKA